MKVLARLRAYTAHEDPAAAVANTVALVVGWNTPFYPLYTIALAGWRVGPFVLLILLSTPFFLAIPMVSRRSSRAGRLALPLVGTVNTLWCLKLLGPETGVALFFIPCVALATLLYRREERLLFFVAATLPLAAYFVPSLGHPVIDFTPAAAMRMAALNAASVLTLTYLLALQFAGLLRGMARR